MQNPIEQYQNFINDTKINQIPPSGSSIIEPNLIITHNLLFKHQHAQNFNILTEFLSEDDLTKVLNKEKDQNEGHINNQFSFGGSREGAPQYYHSIPSSQSEGCHHDNSQNLLNQNNDANDNNDNVTKNIDNYHPTQRFTTLYPRFPQLSESKTTAITQITPPATTSTTTTQTTTPTQTTATEIITGKSKIEPSPMIIKEKSNISNLLPPNLELSHPLCVYHIDNENILQYNNHCYNFWTSMLENITNSSQKKDKNDDKNVKNDENNNDNDQNSNQFTSSIPPNPQLFLQYANLIAKCWQGIGIIHLHEFHIPLSIFFGVNVTRYLIASDAFDKGTFSIKLSSFFQKFHPWIPSSQHMFDGKHYVRPGYVVDGGDEGSEWNGGGDVNHSSLIPQSKSQQSSSSSPSSHIYLHTVSHFHPSHILSILQFLQKKQQLSPIIFHYLSYIIPLPSFCNLISSILSPHFDIIIPITLPMTPTPALFHTIFTILQILFSDLVLLLEPIYELLIGSTSSIPVNIEPKSSFLLFSSSLSEPKDSDLNENIQILSKNSDLNKNIQDLNENIHILNTQPFLYAQPTPYPTDLLHIQSICSNDGINTVSTSQTRPTMTSSTKSMAENVENDDSSSSILKLTLNHCTLRPASILINTLLDDASSNVIRITNGLK